MVVIVRTGTYERHLVHRLCHQRQQFADLKPGDIGGDRLVLAANLGGGIRFWVESVVMRKPTAQVDENNGFGAIARFAGFGGTGFSCAQIIRERQPEGTQPADTKKIATGSPITGASCLSIQGNIEHR